MSVPLALRCRPTWPALYRPFPSRFRTATAPGPRRRRALSLRTTGRACPARGLEGDVTGAQLLTVTYASGSGHAHVLDVLENGSSLNVWGRPRELTAPGQSAWLQVPSPLATPSPAT